MTRVLVLGVNPFEDLPGYQLLSLLKSSGEYEIIAADDSAPALAILSRTGTKIETLPHPSEDPRYFTGLVANICAERSIDILLPGTDSHLYALASCLSDQPQLGRLCPTLEWLASQSLLNKLDLQDWASAFAATPTRWAFDDEGAARNFTSDSRYPIMVKGVRKGAVKCDDELEAIVARRAILRNPANQGPGGGAYAESVVDGEEHSLFVLAGARGERLRTFSFRKLAVTQLGTTLAARVNRDLPLDIDVDGILAELTAPTVLELEWRKDGAGRSWLFEINVRFPSWIGSLDHYGLRLLEDYMDRVLHSAPDVASASPGPAEGSIFYRLPQSGFLQLEAAFAAPSGNGRTEPTHQGYGPKMPLLWESASPHQFRLK